MTIEQFLGQLAERVPAPGGGASAALHAAQAAALLAMVARYSTGPSYRDDEEVISRVRSRADELRQATLELAECDVAAFTVVADAYRLPKGSESDAAARSEAIAAALVGAAQPPAGVIVAAAELMTLAEQLTPVGNLNVITDVGAATDAARAAATTARLNVEINLGGIVDDQARRRLAEIVATVDDIVERADQVSAAVRSMIAR